VGGFMLFMGKEPLSTHWKGDWMVLGSHWRLQRKKSLCPCMYWNLISCIQNLQSCH